MNNDSQINACTFYAYFPLLFQMKNKLKITLLTCLFTFWDISYALSRMQEDRNPFIEIKRLDKLHHSLDNYNIIFNDKEEQHLTSSKSKANQQINNTIQFDFAKKKSSCECTFCKKSDQDVYLRTYKMAKAKHEKEMNMLLDLYIERKQLYNYNSNHDVHLTKEDVDFLLRILYDHKNEKSCRYFSPFSCVVDSIMNRMNMLVHLIKNQFSWNDSVPWSIMNAFLILVATSYLHDLFQSHIKRLERCMNKSQKRYNHHLEELRYLIVKDKVKHKRHCKESVDGMIPYKEERSSIYWEPLFDHL